MCKKSLVYHRSTVNNKLDDKVHFLKGISQGTSMCFLKQLLGWVLIAVSFNCNGTIALV